jgi:hypothetical protein
VLEHDFGLVRPLAAVLHAFEVRNQTAQRWTLESIGTTCVCTVAEVSAKSIAPGATERFTVNYQAGGEPGDASQGVTLRFRESDAPTVHLQVRAAIRAPLTAFPKDVVLGDVGQGQPADGTFSVHNYSDRDWSGLAVQAAPPWLAVQVTPVPVDSEAIEAPGVVPRQLCRVTVSANTAGLAPRGYLESLKLAADGLPAGVEPIVGEVPVELAVNAPVEASPSQVFFGRIAAGQPATEEVVLSFWPGYAPNDASEISATCDSAHPVELRWTRLADRVWKLSVVLMPDAGEEFLSGMVAIGFADERLPPLSLELHGMVGGP